MMNDPLEVAVAPAALAPGPRSNPAVVHLADPPRLLVRSAGMPRSALHALRFPETVALIDRSLDAEEWCAEHAERVCDALHAAIGPVRATEAAAALIQLRRDVFNDRHPRAAPDPGFLRAHLSGADLDLLEGWLRRREERARLLREGPGTFERELADARVALGRHGGDPVLRRGIVLSSLSMHRAVGEHLATPPERRGARIGKVERSMVRYLTRAAAKNSPFSTFAVTGVATLHDAGEAAPPASGPPRSAVRLNQALVRHLGQRMARHPELRPHCPVRANPNVVEQGESWLVFSRRDAPGPPRKFVGTEEVLASVPATGAVRRVAAFVAACGGELRMGELEAALAKSTGGGAEARSFLARLVESGILECGIPIPEGEPCGLDSIRAWIEDVPGELAARLEHELGRVAAIVEQVAAASADGREALLTELETVVASMLELLSEERRSGWRNHLVYEDCVAEGPVSVPGPAAAAVRDLALFARLAPLLDDAVFHRESLKHVLARDFGGGPVPLLPFAAHYFAILHGSAGGTEPFAQRLNPFGLPQLRQLASLRDELTRELATAMRGAGGGLELHPGWIEGFLPRLPPCARAHTPLSAFCQPYMDAAGGGLVINQIVGGPLRLLARLCSLVDTGSLPEELSRRLVSEFAEVGVPCEVGGTFGFNANNHARIAPRELDYAGDWGDGEDRYALPELELGVDAGGDLYLALARSGERIVPLELGMMAPGHQPWLRRLLTYLHQPSLRDLRPSSHLRAGGIWARLPSTPT